MTYYPEDSGEKSMPYSEYFEKEMIGILLRDFRVAEQLPDLNEDLFFNPLHKIICNKIKYAIEKGYDKAIDIIDIDLQTDMQYINAGGKQYLQDLEWDLTVTTPKDCYGLLLALSLKRKMLSAGEVLVDGAIHSAVSDINACIDKAQSILQVDSNNQSKFCDIKTLVADVLKRADAARLDRNYIHGLPTGLSDLDRLLGGFKNGELIILAARPSMGKTALAATFAYNVAKAAYYKEKGGVAFFSLEMSAEQVTKRLMSMHCKSTNATMLDTGRTNESQTMSDNLMAAIKKDMQILQQMPLYIDDTAGLSISNLRMKIRALVKKQDISLVVVDYLQLITSKRSESRVIEIGVITAILKEIAKELNIPVVALAQLSRSVDARENKRPLLSDLRESGSIEQDADVVMFLYRESYYLERERPTDPGEEPDDPQAFLEWKKAQSKYIEWENKCAAIGSLSELLISKNRNGSIGSVDLSFNRGRTLFENKERNEAEMNWE